MMTNRVSAETEIKQISISTTVFRHSKYDSAVLNLSEADFDAAGFVLGDSCDVRFSNGYEMNDVPYLNGHYTKAGTPVICAYPNEKNVTISNTFSDFWTPAGLKWGDTVHITLRESGKYRRLFEALGHAYSVKREDFSSDAAFANFYAMKAGKIRRDFFYRGCSPVDNRRMRAPYVDREIAQVGIRCIVNLSDTKTDVEKYIAGADFDSPYAASLYEEGRLVPLHMGMDYTAGYFKEGVAEGMRFMMRCGGPVYIHCLEGKDRTGFICMLMEALAGAGYDEMRDDYMKTYENYYGITREGEPDRYDAIVTQYFDMFAAYLCGIGEQEAEAQATGEQADGNSGIREQDARKTGALDADVAKQTGTERDALRNADYVASARRYFTECGLGEHELDELEAFLTQGM